MDWLTVVFLALSAATGAISWQFVDAVRRRDAPHTAPLEATVAWVGTALVWALVGLALVAR